MPFGLWFATQITASPLTDAYCVTVITDDICHLWLRLTNITPQKHPLSRRFRGLNIEGDVYYCFVAYSDIEQIEAGDTLLHTFQVPFATAYSLAYFYLHGEVAGTPSPSTSPITILERPTVSPILNPSFEDWAPAPPLFPWPMPEHWTGIYTPGKFYEWIPEPTIKVDGLYSLRLGAGATNATTGVHQSISAVPYREQSIVFKIYGKTQLAHLNTKVTFSSDGTPPINITQSCPAPDFARVSLPGTVPADATFLRFVCQVYAPAAGYRYAYYDKCTLELP